MVVRHAGGCLCGAVRFSVAGDPRAVVACHCTMCRRWSSGPYFAVECGRDVVLEGEPNIGVCASSDWAERGFCKLCGSNLFYRLRDSGDYQISAGSFDDPSDFTLDLQVFVDEQPPYCGLAQKSKMMTRAEVIAMFAPDAGDGEKP